MEVTPLPSAFSYLEGARRVAPITTEVFVTTKWLLVMELIPITLSSEHSNMHKTKSQTTSLSPCSFNQRKLFLKRPLTLTFNAVKQKYNSICFSQVNSNTPLKLITGYLQLVTCSLPFVAFTVCRKRAFLYNPFLLTETPFRCPSNPHQSTGLQDWCY